MKLYTLGLYEKSMPDSLSLYEKLAAAKETGYDFMELSIDESDRKLSRLDWSDDEINDLRRSQERAGIQIKTMCLSGHRRFPLGDPDEEARSKGLEIADKAVRLASLLGIRIIQIAGYDVYYKPSTPETREKFEQGLACFSELAAREGVTLAFETMETEFMNTAEKAAQWVKRIGSPYLQIYPDLGNITNAAVLYGGNVGVDLAAGEGHIAAMHLKESKPGIYREVPYGEGHVAFSSGITAVWKQGVRMFVGEFWYSGEDDYISTLRRNNEFLRSKIQNAING